MSESIRGEQSWVGSGVITFVIGLLFVAVGAEALAAFNACVADAACLPYASALNVGAFFAILAVGIVLAVVAAWVLAVRVTRASCNAWPNCPCRRS